MGIIWQLLESSWLVVFIARENVFLSDVFTAGVPNISFSQCFLNYLTPDELPLSYRKGLILTDLTIRFFLLPLILFLICLGYQRNTSRIIAPKF